MYKCLQFPVLGLECYECGSDLNGDCGKLFNPRLVHSRPCGYEETVCMKKVTKKLIGNIHFFRSAFFIKSNF